MLRHARLMAHRHRNLRKKFVIYSKVTARSSSSPVPGLFSFSHVLVFARGSPTACLDDGKEFKDLSGELHYVKYGMSQVPPPNH